MSGLGYKYLAPCKSFFTACSVQAINAALLQSADTTYSLLEIQQIHQESVCLPSRDTRRYAKILCATFQWLKTKIVLARSQTKLFWTFLRKPPISRVWLQVQSVDWIITLCIDFNLHACQNRMLSRFYKAPLACHICGPNPVYTNPKVIVHGTFEFLLDPLLI